MVCVFYLLFLIFYIAMSTLEKIQFENLLVQLAEQGGSDLHLSVGSPARLRLADELRPVSEDVLTNIKIEELIFPLLTAEQKEMLLKEKALIFGRTFPNGLRFKINLFYQKGSLSADLHFISPTPRTIKELGLPRSVEHLAELEKGLVIITGPYRAGKTTTAVAILEHINSSRPAEIVTLEAPIEFILTSKVGLIQQREVGVDTANLVEGLKDCLEASADVIMASPIESKEEVEALLELAEQGKLVLAVTSANSVLDVITKLLTYFNEEEQKRVRSILSRVLQAVIFQDLVLNKNNNWLVVPEILCHTEAVRLSIQDNKLHQINNIIKTSAAEGMISFEQSLAGLVKQGEVTLKEALKHVEDKTGFKQMVT